MWRSPWMSKQEPSKTQEERCALSLHALVARVMFLHCAQEGKKYLEFHGWLAAFDTFALLVVVLEQMTFAEAMQYKAIVLKVGCTAGS